MFWIRAIIIWDGARDVRELLRAAHASEVHVRVVGLATSLEPVVPVIAPLATWPQIWRQTSATSLVEAATVVVVAIEIAAAVARELPRAPIGEEALPSARDLDVEAVVAVYVIADVRDLDDNSLADQRRVRPTPILRGMTLVDKLELVALPAIVVASEAVTAADRDCREAHGQRL